MCIRDRAVVPTAVAFNLAVAWLVAGAAVGAYGVTYNLVAGRRATSDEQRVTRSPLAARRSSLLTRRAVLLGIIAALAVPIAGTLPIGRAVVGTHGSQASEAGKLRRGSNNHILKSHCSSAAKRFRNCRVGPRAH